MSFGVRRIENLRSDPKTSLRSWKRESTGNKVRTRRNERNAAESAKKSIGRGGELAFTYEGEAKSLPEGEHGTKSKLKTETRIRLTGREKEVR